MGEVKFLLDTCTLLWWWSEPEKLSSKVLALLRDPRNLVYISAASAWEVATKNRIGKLPEGSRLLNEWAHRLGVDGFKDLAITSAHAARAGMLPGDYRDPFDRMLAAQSLLEDLPVLTCDPQIAGLGAETRW